MLFFEHLEVFFDVLILPQNFLFLFFYTFQSTSKMLVDFLLLYKVLKAESNRRYQFQYHLIYLHIFKNLVIKKKSWSLKMLCCRM